jgi:zinc transport system ATP-binding protein
MANAASLASSVLDVAHLTVRFGDLVAVHDVTFSVPAGASVAVIGPNGSGKTALFRALIGAIPYDGTIRWAPAARVGYVPQKLDLQRDVPVTGVDFLRARTALLRQTDTDRDEALALTGLSLDVCRRPIGTLSGGQFQRLLISFALIGRPNILLLDEPTSGVDESGQDHLNALVRRLQQERNLTVLLISHDLSVVYRYATMVVCLGGKHVMVGPPSAVLTEGAIRDAYGTEVAFHAHGH